MTKRKKPEDAQVAVDNSFIATQGTVNDDDVDPQVRARHEGTGNTLSLTDRAGAAGTGDAFRAASAGNSDCEREGGLKKGTGEFFVFRV